MLKLNNYHDGYIAFRKKQKKKLAHRKERRPLDHHLGTQQEYIERLEAEARKFGACRPVEHWGGHDYAVRMFDRIADERTLRRAWDSLKGEAPGEDGVRPRNIHRYVMYRKWCSACGFHGKKAPPYSRTAFPRMTAGELFIVSLLCVPNPRFDVQCVDFEAGHWSQSDLPSNSSLRRQHKHYKRNLNIRGFRKNSAHANLPAEGEDDGGRRKLFFELQRLPGHYLLSHDDAECNRLLARAEKCGMAPGIADVALHIRYDGTALADMLPKAGCDRRRIDGLADIVVKGVAREIEWWHSQHAKSFVLFIPVMEQIARYQEYPWISLEWEAMRWVRDLLRQIPKNGKGFRPGAMRKVEIPKTDGGIRTLSLPSAVERTVAKAALIVLQNAMEEVFLPSSVGCRYDKDRFDALSTIAVRYPASPGKVILLADIKKAFDNVPHDKVMEIVERYVPNNDTRTLLERIIRRPGFESGIGLAQGDPLSPLLLNMLLHECLDVPVDGVMKKNGLVHFRYVDDLSVFGLTSRDQGEEVLGVLGEHLRRVGLTLHTAAPKTQIVDLACAPAECYVEPGATGDFQVDRYLGLGLRGGKGGELEFFLPATWEERIRDMYIRAERKIELGGYADTPGAYTHIHHATTSWIRAFAPALRCEDKERIAARIVAICKDASRHPVGDPEALHKAWDDAQDWWTRKCGEA